MSAALLTITEAALLEMIERKVGERVNQILPPERVEELAEEYVEERIGLLTLDQAARHLQCKNERQLTDFLREHRIPLVHFGAKKRFVRICDIQAAQEKHLVKVAHDRTTPPARIVPIGGRAA